MLGENIKRLRKEKGFTQQELAIRLHVVRQTVSKWEKGLSVPDAAMLQRLSEELDVPVEALLGASVSGEAEGNQLVAQLARINEQLAVKNRRARRIWTSVAIILALLVLLPVLTVPLFYARIGSGVAYSAAMSAEDPVYTEQEVEDAFETVTKYFKRHFKGCTLKSLSYSEEYSVQRSEEWAAQYDAGEAIVLLSAFTTNAKGGDGSLNPNSTYAGWQWILTRDDGGPWEVQTWGYG